MVDAFFAAARDGDFEALVALLDPDIVMRADGGPRRREVTMVVRGAPAVAGRALMFANPATTLRPVLVNGAAGVVVSIAGRPVSVMGFTISNGIVVGHRCAGRPGPASAGWT